MTRARFALLCMLAAGCTKNNPQYCDDGVGCPSGMKCDLVRRTCVDSHADLAMEDLREPPDLSGCVTSTDCIETDKPICDQLTKKCHACSSAMVDGGDLGDFECVDKDAGRPICNMGRCVQCQDASNCANPTPACDTAVGTCVKCTDHAQCASLVCDDDGTCHDENDVLYVNNTGTPNCDNKGGNGPQNAPFCVVQDAVNRGTPKNIRIIGSDTNYAGFAITNKSVRIVGPGPGAPKPAKIVGNNTPAVLINNGNTGKSIIDGLDMSATMMQDVVNCSGNQLPDLTIVRSVMHDAGGIGVAVSGCQIALDRDLVTKNLQGGVNILSGSYNITNCFVVNHNTPSQAAVALGSATGFFRHNTVAFNQTMTMGFPGGIACGIGQKSIDRSIVWKNTQANGTQLSGTCMLDFVDIDEPPMNATDRNVAPDFVSAIDYHLKVTANNMACCIDQVDSSLVDHDFDGTARPQPVNGRYDIGAHEVK